MESNKYRTYSYGKGKEYPFDFKLNAIYAAQQLGIKPAAKRFKIARNTLKTWIACHKTKGKQGLNDKRAGPSNIPHKISKELEEKIVLIRKIAPCFGPKRIQYMYDIPCSLGAIHRVIKAHNLIRKKRTYTQKKNDLRKIKQRLKSLTYLQMDVKHLRDIPNYLDQMMILDLPRYQYTIRDVKSGMIFLGFSNELSELNARTMACYLLESFKKYRFSLSNITIQTDNGSEFSGAAKRMETNKFVQTLEQYQVKHKYIRPGHCNAQADVESIHNTIEKEFFDITTFTSRENFFHKAQVYQYFYNLIRPNFSKDTKAPWQICETDWKQSNIASQAVLISCIDLDKISYANNSPSRGQTIPIFPEIILILLLIINVANSYYNK